MFRRLWTAAFRFCFPFSDDIGLRSRRQAVSLRLEPLTDRIVPGETTNVVVSGALGGGVIDPIASSQVSQDAPLLTSPSSSANAKANPQPDAAAREITDLLFSTGNAPKRETTETTKPVFNGGATTHSEEVTPQLIAAWMGEFGPAAPSSVISRELPAEPEQPKHADSASAAATNSGGAVVEATAGGGAAGDTAGTPDQPNLSSFEGGEPSGPNNPTTLMMGMIGDFVFQDVNGDGSQGTGENPEPGIANVTVRLLNAGTQAILATTVTNSTGFYQFNGVASGSYIVEFVAPAGMSFTQANVGPDHADSDADPTTGRTAAFSYSSGIINTTIDAGFLQAAPSVVTVSASDADASEVGPDAGTFTFSRTGNLSQSLTVQVAVSGTAGPSDYVEPLGGSVTFAAGQATVVKPITPVQDSLIETDESLTVTLAPAPGYTVGSPATATVVIHDLSAPEVYLTVSDYWASPAPGDTARFVVNRSGELSQALQVNYVVGGTAVEGVDYQPLSGTVFIPAGAASAPVVVTALPGAAAEGAVFVALGITPGAGYTIAYQSEAGIGILNAPAVPTLFFPHEDSGENEDAGTALVDVYLEFAPPDQSVTVNYATSNGTALASVDYLGVSGTLTFAPGENLKTIAVPLIDNTVSTGDRSFHLTLSSPTNAVLGVDSTARLTIIEDDLATVTIAASQASASENGTPGQFTITRTGNIDNDLTVYYDVFGTASAGEDYAALTGSVELPAGVASVDVLVTPLDDAMFEGSETIVGQIASDRWYATGSTSQATVTILDDTIDSVPVVSIIASEPEGIEDSSTPGRFTISRTGSLQQDLTVSYALEGDAVAGVDFASLPGTVTIPAGSSSVTLTINPIQDGVAEGYEGVVASLLSSVSYALAALYFDAVSIRDTSETTKPDVKEVHPLDKDFKARTEGEPVGRIIASAVHGGGFHTTAKTTVANTVAQTKEGKVKITAYLEKLVKDVTVYFEVIDPREGARYSNKTKKWDSELMDEKPQTTWDQFETNHNIENPRAWRMQNDNRDPKQNMQTGTLAAYNKFQTASISATSAASKIVKIDGKMQAAAEIELTVSSFYSGDNYIVRATTVNPGTQGVGKPNKPFNAGSGIGEDDSAKIDKEKVKASALLTAWKRIYYEYDPTFRVGAHIDVDTKVDDIDVTVSDVKGLKVGDKVQILDKTNREPELRKIEKITGKVITLDKKLTKAYKAWSGTNNQYGYIGRQNGYNSTDLYLPDVSKVADTFDDAFVEIMKVEKGSAPIQWTTTFFSHTDMLGYAEFHYAHHKKFKVDRLKPTPDQQTDTFQLVGAQHNVATRASSTGESDPHNNQSIAFLQSVIGKEEFKPEKQRDTVNHEIAHQYDPEGFANGGHNLLRAHDDSDGCLMNAGDDSINRKGRRIDDNEIVELSLDQLYKIRDFKSRI